METTDAVKSIAKILNVEPKEIYGYVVLAASDDGDMLATSAARERPNCKMSNICDTTLYIAMCAEFLRSIATRISDEVHAPLEAHVQTMSPERFVDYLKGDGIPVHADTDSVYVYPPELTEPETP